MGIFGKPGPALPQQPWELPFSDSLVSVKDFGAIGDNKANDTNAIKRAVLWAYEHGSWIEFPYGKYLTTESIPHLHEVYKTGPGVIIREEREFPVSVRSPSLEAKLFSSPAGGGDGLSAKDPLTPTQITGALEWYGGILIGDWVIEFLEGEYAGSFTTPSGLMSTGRIEFTGPVVPHPGISKAVFHAPGEAFGFRTDTKTYTKVAYIRVTGVDRTVSNSSTCFSAPGECNVYWFNCQIEPTEAYHGFYAGSNCIMRIKGGKIEGKSWHGIRCYANATVTINYNVVAEAEAIVWGKESCIKAGIYGSNCYGDVHWLRMNNVGPKGVWADIGGRFQITENCEVIKHTEGDFVGELGASFTLGPGEVTYETRNMYGGSTVQLIDNAYHSHVLRSVFLDTTEKDLTGTTEITLLKELEFAIEKAMVNKNSKVVVELYGSISGAGTKTVRFNYGNIALLAAPVLAEAVNKAYSIKFEMFPYEKGKCLVLCTIAEENAGAKSGPIGPFVKEFEIDGVTKLKLNAQLSDAAGHLKSNRAEVFTYS